MTRAIAALLDIMGDADAPLKRRIEATEGILQYDAPEAAVEAAKHFLTSVFEDSEQVVELRLDALKLMRKAEAPRITQPAVSSAEERENREKWRDIEMGLRRVKISSAGLTWGPGWADDLMSDTYKPPSGDANEALRKYLPHRS